MLDRSYVFWSLIGSEVELTRHIGMGFMETAYFNCDLEALLQRVCTLGVASSSELTNAEVYL